MASKQAHIYDLISTSPEGFNTPIGEDGVKLSGGQRQRIAIARAFYKNASILCFDEATSALDQKTQEKIISSIKQIDKNITVISIAHRRSALQFCDKIYSITGKSIRLVSSKKIL